MKKTILILFLTLIAFVTLTLTTAVEQKMVDGENIYGFPLTFYIEYSLHTVDPLLKPSGFYPFALFVDIAVSLSISLTFYLGLLFALKKLKRTPNTALKTHAKK